MLCMNADDHWGEKIKWSMKKLMELRKEIIPKKNQKK